MATTLQTQFPKLEARLRKHIQSRWPQMREVRIRARGAFVYVEVQGPDDEEPAPLCRLRYMGNAEVWQFSFYSWAHGNRGRYEDSYLANGSPVGTPEECFDTAAISFDI
jgi:hypothetical protein